jgi:hypothetical protein
MSTRPGKRWVVGGEAMIWLMPFFIQAFYMLQKTYYLCNTVETSEVFGIDAGVYQGKKLRKSDKCKHSESL